jgi:DNA modification methylase
MKELEGVKFLSIYEKDHSGTTLIARAKDKSWSIKKGTDLIIFVNVEGEIERRYTPYKINKIEELRDFVEYEIKAHLNEGK